MAGSAFDPGGASSSGQLQAPVHLSYADRLKANIKFNQRLKRNILEIVLEKENSEVEINIKESFSRMFSLTPISVQKNYILCVSYTKQKENSNLHAKIQNRLCKLYYPHSIAPCKRVILAPQ